MIFGAILAGGVGSRMNISDMPKQFLDLGEKPIIVHTLEKFKLCSRLDHIYLGVHPDWLTHTNDLIEKYLGKAAAENVHVVAGGTDRNSTIFNIISDIEKNFGESEDNIIITHDSVRPFVTQRMIDENIDAAIKYGAVDTVTSAIDTIVESDDGEFIKEIPNRQKMYQGQTPQSFKISVLKKLYSELTDDEKAILTDACKICIVKGYPVYMVEGEISNIKITTVSDYKIAQAMVGGIKID
mgnify:FL=1